jgi:hypothetical protein
LIIKILERKDIFRFVETTMALTVQLISVGLGCGLAFVGLGGGLYEFSVVDPFWPRRVEIVQPARGGIDRKRFWIPVHVAFELALIVALVFTWSQPEVRFWLLTALASHAVMRIWSAFDFIPKALAFERVDAATISEAEARSWRGEACCAYRSI